MNRLSHGASAAFLSMAALGACASGGASSSSTASVAPSAQAVGSTTPVNLIQWTGSFHPATEISSGGGGTHVSVSGGAKLTATSGHGMHAHLTLSTNAGIADATPVHWAIAQGDCHNGALPVAPVSAFPDLNISNDRGELDADVAVDLPTSGRYHLNVYKSESTDEADVFTCAPLQMSRIK